jgi:hypothetical protein
MGNDAALSRIHAMKFYAMANALDSLVRVGQDLADEFVARHDYVGARDVLERNVLPNVIEHKMVDRIVPVRALRGDLGVLRRPRCRRSRDGSFGSL